MGTTQLNENLQPVNSPVTQSQGAVSAYDFFSEHDRSSIMLSKIRNFSFNQAVGGTLTLGGTNNGNGYFQIKDSLGSVIVIGDNRGLGVYDYSSTVAVQLGTAGITVNNGKITVINSSSQTTLDAKGIVSNSNNFITTATTNAGLNQSFSGTASVDGSASSANIVLTRTTTVLFLLSTVAYLTESVGNTADGRVSLNIDGVTDFARQTLRSGNDYASSRTTFVISQLGSGTHPVKIQGRLTNIYAGAPSMTLADFSWSYILLGT